MRTNAKRVRLLALFVRCSASSLTIAHRLRMVLCIREHSAEHTHTLTMRESVN